MRKLLLSLFILSFASLSYAGVITVDPFVTPDDVTIAHLETFRTKTVNAINSPDGSLIQTGTISTSSLDANANPEYRWGEGFNEYVFTGLLPPTTSGTLISTTTAGTAYVEEDATLKMKRVVKDATAHTYTASKWTYVDLSSTGVFTYSEVSIGGSEPAVAANSIRLARVSSDSTQVAAVRDDRVTALSVGISEDQFRQGLIISVVTPDAITISPGVTYNGTSRISKVGNTVLSLGTATDFATGVSQRGTATLGFVAVNNLGSIKLTTTAPTKADTSGNTVGKLRYSVIGTDYWRVLAWFYMNTTGSGNIDKWNFGNFKDGFVSNSIIKDNGISITLSDTTYDDDLNDTLVNFYTSGSNVNITSNLISLGGEGSTKQIGTIISIDSTSRANSETINTNNAGTDSINNSNQWNEVLSQGLHTIKIVGKCSANSVAVTPYSLIVEER